MGWNWVRHSGEVCCVWKRMQERERVCVCVCVSETMGEREVGNIRWEIYGGKYTVGDMLERDYGRESVSGGGECDMEDGMERGQWEGQ